MKQTYKTNVYLQQLAVDLYRFGNENKVALWKRIADDLIVPTRQKRLVNIFKLDLYSKDGETIIVPGKVLGTGDIHHKVHVAAFDFSRSAVDKIKQAKGSVMTIPELIQKNPKAKDVRILG